MLAHLGQKYLAALNLGQYLVRPNSGIGYPGMQAPFGIYEARDGLYVSIAMSPYETPYETLEAPQLAVYDDLTALFDKRDEVWKRSMPRPECSTVTTCSPASSLPISGAPPSMTSAPPPRTRRSSGAR